MLSDVQQTCLTRFCQALIDQDAARVIVPPKQPSTGFWFGGGNLVEDADGTFYLCGRYRNFGDSRTGLAAGERGLELAIFRSTDRGASFEKLLSFSKSDLNVGDRTVLSIEGSALRIGEQAGKPLFELFVSTEKAGIDYPAGLESFLKPGAGVWTIERLAADSIAGLAQAPVETVLSCNNPQFLHVKDPFLYETGDRGLGNGETVLGFCTHPFSWSSSNTGYTRRSSVDAAFGPADYTFFPRGTTWDVAISRATAMLRVPAVGLFADSEAMTLIFYDGGESLRNLDEHKAAVTRPRGYSCEELSGVAVAPEVDLSASQRLSITGPLFVSPYGTGSSRYIDVLETDEGYYATWEQSQPDESQCLVMNFVSRERAEALLQGA